MRKFILLFFILNLIHLNIFAQIQSGKIDYKVMLTEEVENPLDTVKEASADVKGFISHIQEQKIKMLPSLKYSLNFNKEEALFSYSEDMRADNKDVEMKDVAMTVGIYDKFYFNLNKDEITNQRRFFHDEIILIKSKISNIKWNILPETKTIAGYKCQKAVTADYDLMEDSYIGEELVVWFTKEIPFSFGPGLAGLPGMIMGVEIKKFYMYADELKLFKKEKKISSPSKGRKMTGSEFQEELEESFRKMDEGTWDWDSH